VTYIQVEQGLGAHPKTRHLARLIGQHPRYAVGLLCDVWDWAVDAKPDGMLGEVPAATIASVFGFRSKDLLEILTAAGFVCSEACVAKGLPADVHRTGRLHDWDKHSGKLVETRAKDSLRKEHDRKGHSRPVDNCPKCPHLSVGQQPKPRTNAPIDRSASAGRPPDSPSPVPRSVPSVPSVYTPSPHAGATDGVGTGQTTAERAATIVEQAEPPWRAVLEQLHEKAASDGTLQSFVTHFGDTTYKQREGTHVLLVRDALERDWIARRYASEIHAVLEGELVIEVWT
jgi:hypothetical protein